MSSKQKPYILLQMSGCCSIINSLIFLDVIWVRFEQYVMAYRVEQDRLRAILPQGFIFLAKRFWVYIL